MFDQVAFDCLHHRYGLQDSTPRAIFDAIQQLGTQHKKGIWEFIGKRLGVSSAQVHNYFHNTWIKQFYSDTKITRPVINQMITDMLRNGTPVDTKYIVNQVIVMFPQHNFNIRQLQQIVNIQKLRLSKRAFRTQDSMSADSASQDQSASVSFTQSERPQPAAPEAEPIQSFDTHTDISMLCFDVDW